MILLDLFSGIGGFSLGFQQAGYRFTKHYFAENNIHAAASYQYNFPASINLGDVKKINSKKHKVKPTIITFGSPCQDFSIAGERAGATGARGKLTFEAIRIIKEFRPQIFVFENVKGLLSSNKGEDFTSILNAIAQIGLYDCEWQLVNSRWVLPQNRERIFLVGHLRGKSKPGIFPLTAKSFKHTKASEKITQLLYWKNSKEQWVLENRKHSPALKTQTDLVRQPLIVDFKGNTRKSVTVKKEVPTLRAQTHGHEPLVVDTRNQSGTRIGKKVVPALAARDAKDPVMICAQRKRGSQQKMECRNDKASNTLTTVSKDNYVQLHKSSIRKLTEIEYERLQGFPDNWTKYGLYQDGEIKEIAKTNRYSLVGNSLTVPFVRIIAKKLITNNL